MSKKQTTGRPNCTCDQGKYIKNTGKPCPHWENVLGPISSNNTRREVSLDSQYKEVHSKVNDAPISELESDYDSVAEEMNIMRRMRDTGLSEQKINVVIDRILRNKLFKEIAVDYGYASKQAAREVFVAAVKVLKSNGFGIKGKI